MPQSSNDSYSSIAANKKRPPEYGLGIYINKSTRVLIVACALLYLLGGVFHYLDVHMAERLPIRLSAISYIAYCTICMLAFIYTRKNIPQPITRRYMLVGIVLLLSWEFIIMAEELVFPSDFIVNRALWYLYYVPTLAVPNVILLVALFYNRNPNDPINGGWYLTFIPTILGVILVLTNDYHRICFTFPEGIENFHTSYEYNIGYYLVMGWMYTMFLGGMIIMFYRARNQIHGMGIGIIVFTFGLSIVYFFWHITGHPFLAFINDMYGVPEVFMGIIVVSIAGCISSGLIRANFNFQELFEASNLGAILVDRRGTIRYRSMDSINPTKEQMDEAIDNNIYIDKNTRFQGERITSGSVFWIDDLSSVNELAENLNEVHMELEQDNSLIGAENKMIARRTKADEQNRLYNMMARGVEDELDTIEEILASTTPKNEDFREKLALACVYKAYVKRYCNLMLLRQDDSLLNSFDLVSSIRESTDYIRLNGISCSYITRGEGYYSADKLLFAYKVFQRTIEKCIEKDTSLDVTLSFAPIEFTLRIRAEGKGAKSALESLNAPEIESALASSNAPSEASAKMTENSEILREAEALGGRINWTDETNSGRGWEILLTLPGEEGVYE